MQQKSPRKRICLSALILSNLLLLFTAFFLHQKISFISLFVFILAILFISILQWRSFSSRAQQIDSQFENCTEEINLLRIENSKSQELGIALKSKIIRYDNLKKIIEDLNKNLKLDAVMDTLTQAVYTLISSYQGTALLFLIDRQAQKLKLARSIKEDPDLVILTKEGDILDHWVLRHTSPLIVEDIKKDFRFDTDNIKEEGLRTVSAIISSPLVTHHSLLGLLRLENKTPGFFTQDDLRFLSLVSDLGAVVLENSLLFQKTQDLAIHDDLTKTYTRQHFNARLADEAKRCLRLDQVLSVMMIDIDFFKQYNDKFGHTAGDLVLKKIAFLMQEVLAQENCLIGRFGGEEFLVMLSGWDKKKSFQIAEKLRERIEKEHIILRRQATNVTVSIGIASLPIDAKSEDELVQKADKAMYDAKQKGRNQVCCI